MQKKRVTIVEVAKSAGVSVGTVSNVLNRHNAVPLAEETVRKVNEAIRTLGYRRNVIAANLSRQKTFELGMLIPSYDEYFVKFTGAVEQIVLERGYHLSVFSASEKPELERRHLELMLQRRVDGLFCHGLAMSPETAGNIVSDGTPVVMFNAWDWPDIDVGAVNLDVVSVCAQAVVHLFEQGCRAIFYLGLKQASSTDEQRRIGFLNGTASLPQSDVLTGILEFEPGWLKEMEKQSAGIRPIGVLCFDDYVAFSFMSKLLELGYRVPEEVKIIGINNSFISRTSFPGMTSIAIPYKLQAQAAVRSMMERLGEASFDAPETRGSGGSAGSPVQIPLQLVPRKSTEL
ncbi:LacI family DNA-binding transcriptional regulator [Paenibacillus sp. MBLB4367]|uniref:LacI family DNA-binding transcriptional regulator n=1 Tax=Paenibacillus sp. MBLB4367 TaxID=3384767 RepID=UPI0039081B73